jgi:hypothetical protein
MSVRFRFVSMLLNSVRSVLPDRVPVVEHPVRPAEEAAPKARVRLPGDDRRQQLGPVLRVVLQVGVLHDDHVPRGGGQGGPDRLPLAPVLGLQHEAVDVARLVEGDEALPGAVGRAVVDADDLLLHRRGVDALEDGLDRVQLVVHGDQHRQVTVPGPAASAPAASPPA